LTYEKPVKEHLQGITWSHHSK